MLYNSQALQKLCSIAGHAPSKHCMFSPPPHAVQLTCDEVLFSSYVFSHSYIYTASLWIACTVSRMSIIRRIYFVFSSIYSVHSQFWKHFMSSLLSECTTCLCTCIYKWYILSLLSCVSMLHMLDKLSQQTPLRMLKTYLTFMHDSNAKMYIIFDSVLEFSKAIIKIERYELYFVPIRYRRYEFVSFWNS
jgi:hypothetical protein